MKKELPKVVKLPKSLDMREKVTEEIARTIDNLNLLLEEINFHSNKDKRNRLYRECSDSLTDVRHSITNLNRLNH